MKFNTVFVVDDDKIFHFIIKKLLISNNININPSYFLNGLEALEGLRSKLNLGENQPDLILLDINMPILDGWQFLEEFKKLKDKLKKEITIYIISSSDNQTDLDKAEVYSNEVKNYYLKPISVDEIKSIFLN
ncbi:response regulator [Flavobacterium sp.]|uniref:response regulator n=1 Tax=Flavobacterium sp. TaxID=239 RepID=UPI0025EE3D0F|nr:response regulator [Flavobacterium sp.]